MKRIIWMFMAALMLAPAMAGGQTGAAEKGAQVYSENCARCHNPRAPDEFSDAAWAVIVHHMHVRGYLTELQTEQVLAFLKKANNPPPIVKTTSTSGGMKVATGRTLVSRYGCAGCHVIGGKGGTIGPNLDTVLKRRGEAYIKNKLSNPKFDNPTSVMPRFPLSEAEKKVILGYLRQFAK